MMNKPLVHAAIDHIEYRLLILHVVHMHKLNGMFWPMGVHDNNYVEGMSCGWGLPFGLVILSI